MMYFYNGSVNYNKQQQQTLWQQSYLSKTQEQEIYNFLSIGCGARCREKSKKLNLALQKRKQRNMSKKIISIIRGIGISRGLSKKISLMLEKSGLSLDEQKEIAKNIKKLLLDFNKGLHNMLDLKGLNLSRLPLTLRRFIIALIVLKAEIANLYRLQLEGLQRQIKKNNEPKLSIENRNLEVQANLDLDNHKNYTMGISITKGNWDGTRGMYIDKKNEKNINFDNKTNKRSRNMEENRQKNSKNYDNNEKSFNDKESNLNKNDFYQDRNSHNYCYNN